jgi:hypothetical protein
MKQLFIKIALLILLVFSLSNSSVAQTPVTLSGISYSQNFNSIGTTQPTGWTVVTGASASSSGTTETFPSGATDWASGVGAFGNYASLGAGLPSNANSTTQSNASNRALGVKQTSGFGTFGDPGAAFVLHLTNTTGFVGFSLTFKLMNMDPFIGVGRTATWYVDYGVGATPSSFTTIATSPTPLATIQGAGQDSATITVNFGSVLNDISDHVWIRIVNTATSGSGARPATAIDDAVLTWTTYPTLSVNPSSLNFPGTPVNTPTTAKSFSLTGSGLYGSAITVTAPTHFEISSDGNVPWSSTLTYPNTGFYLNKTVYVRFNPQSSGIKIDSITFSGGSVSSPPKVALTGTQSYFSKSSGDLADPATWGENGDGSGTSPSNFTTANQYFFITNRSTATLISAWAVSGANSRIILGDGTTPCNFTIPSGFSLNASSIIDVSNKATLTLQNATLPSFGSLATGSKVVYDQISTVNIGNSSPYDTLTLTNSGTKTFASGTTTVNGALVYDGSTNGPLTLNAASNATVNLGGNLTYLGTVINPGDANLYTLTSISSSPTQTITTNGNTARFLRIISGSSGNNIILSGSTNVVLGNASGGGLTLNAGTSLDINGDALTFFAGSPSSPTITGTGSIKSYSTSNIIINKTTAGTFGTINFFSGADSLNNLTINHTGSTPTVTLGSNLKICGKLTMANGQLALGANIVTLVSNSSGTASIAATTLATPFTYGSGGFKVQKYLSARRGWRMLGNPLTTSTSLSALASGSSINIGPNDAYDYDAATGWILNSTNSGSAWNGITPLLLFVRGAAGEGVGGIYSGGVSNVTLSVTGQVLVGSITGTLNTWNGNSSTTEPSKFTLLPNPYASPISLRSVLGSTDGYTSGFYNQTGSYSSIIHYYDPSLSQGDVKVLAGGYQTADLSVTDFILPAFSSFFVETVATTSGLGVQIRETAKSTLAVGSNAMFGVNEDDRLILNINNAAGVSYDNWYLRYDNKSSNASGDNRDGTKMSNSVFNLYSIAADKVHLSNDSRNASGTESVPLGLTTTAKQQYIITVAHNGVTGKDLYLKDNLLNTLTKLKEGTSYSFDVTADNATQGEQRFEVVQQAPAIIAQLPTAAIKVSISPNPVSDVLNITSTGNTTVRVTNVLGQLVRTISTADQIIKIPVSNLTKGLYIVEVSNGTERVTEKIIKN